MPIELGLARILKLLTPLNNPHRAFKAIHVAGTNGKGSVCAYLDSVLTHAGILTGRFTSPHLIDRWDCVSIRNKAVQKDIFLASERRVREANQTHSIGASEFELLTATAFDIFARQKVNVAVIEVGLGGRLDATNVLEKPLVTVITRIAMDHQGLLGDTLGAIAREKAGIMKRGARCIVDGENEQEALDAFWEVAEEVGADVDVVKGVEDELQTYSVQTKAWGPISVRTPLPGAHQRANVSVTVAALAHLQDSLPGITPQTIQEGVAAAKWPGRLEWTLISSISQKPLLLDGAHNANAARSLAQYINTLRQKGLITWVMAFSQGKDLDEMLRILVRGDYRDRIAAVEFGDVDGMPWVKPVPTEEIMEIARGVLKSGEEKEDVRGFGTDVGAALKWATEGNEEGTVVVCGSLYLVGEVKKLKREEGNNEE
ncbi:folylpolyglutamate synthase [Saitoella coloradoensis]